MYFQWKFGVDKSVEKLIFEFNVIIFQTQNLNTEITLIAKFFFRQNITTTLKYLLFRNLNKDLT